ncbi:MAG: TlpA family protein disulfide reductase [Acidobacteria bacterium]|nr:TlpA family protein disulfide reductase [Acidobacteriota bacterium]
MRRSLAAALLLFALSAGAANLRDEKQPDRIQAAFPAKAKLRLVNVWATWCVPCVEEMPTLRAIDDAFGAELAMLGVSMDDMIPGAKRDKVLSFLDKQKIAYPNLYYTGNADDLGDRIKFDGEIPITIVYDRNGKELWRHQGLLQRDPTIAELRKLLRRTE